MTAALAVERVQWVREALLDAIDVASAEAMEPGISPQGSALASRLAEEGYARAVEDVTGQIVHVLRPLLGSLDYFASTEINDYAESKTEQAVTLLRRSLSAIHTLGQAAVAPAYAELHWGQLSARSVRTKGTTIQRRFRILDVTTRSSGATFGSWN